MVLVCEGLDTIAEVFVNDVSVGKSKNMFVRYVFDIKSTLKVCYRIEGLKINTFVAYLQSLTSNRFFKTCILSMDCKKAIKTPIFHKSDKKLKWEKHTGS